jgi:ADP-ribosylglycohydrolase
MSTANQKQPSRRDRVLGGILGALVGDALGVPVEFRNRASVQSDPVTGMRGFGTHRQPAGTWSDDGALLLCTVDSLAHHTFDTEDMGRRFLGWYRRGLWSAHGEVFDIGLTTTDAMMRLENGCAAEEAGGREDHCNGNGSLMRILPVALRFAGQPVEDILDRVRRASAITHGHPKSTMSCGLYALVVSELMGGLPAETAWRKARQTFLKAFADAPDLKAFAQLTDDLGSHPEDWIDSGGYVIHTLRASIWSLLTSAGYSECVLKAVNLGGDTDTTGCVAGGLAGVAFGLEGVPQDWRDQLPRKSDLEDLCTRFAELV